MSAENTHILSKGATINETYEVLFFIGEGAFGEVYRVKHKFLGVQVMKVLKEEYVNNTDLSLIVDEAKILSQLTHPNIVRVFDTNSFNKDGKKYYFITMGFVSGETLTDLLERQIQLPVPVALSIEQDILAGLQFVQEQNPPIVHRDINSDNVLLSYDRDKPVAMLSDFGLAQSIDQFSRLPGAAGRYIYFAPECFLGAYLPASDVFSCGILLYRMITGVHPWEYNFEIPGNDPEEITTMVIKSRRKEIKPPSFYNENCSQDLDKVILQSLAKNIEERFKTAAEFLSRLNEKGIGEIPQQMQRTPVNTATPAAEKQELRPSSYVPKWTDKGLGRIAGRNDLKESLVQNIILPLSQKELYEQYKVGLPNGVLFFGPAKCGKHFIAERLAEEIGYDFLEINASDLQANDKIGFKDQVTRSFKQAKEKAPVVLFIDSIEKVLPLNSGNQQFRSSEKNEFLTQVANCHEYGIFIVASTGQPEQMSNKIFGPERLELAMYVSPPDEEARKDLFKFFLANRPSDSHIDFGRLAVSTNNISVAAIDQIINEASKIAVKKRSPISEAQLVEVIQRDPPVISPADLANYTSFRMEKPKHDRKTVDGEPVRGKLNKNTIFISYSHKDQVYMEELKRHFSPFRENLNLWYDAKIKTGDVWEKEIEKALNEAEVAILLLSPDFFNSEFITKYEIPNIQRRQEEGLKIIAIILSPCATDEFNKYQFLNSIDNPVIDMQVSAREKIWLKAFTRVKEMLNDQRDN